MTTKTLQDALFIAAALFVLGVSQAPEPALAGLCPPVVEYHLVSVAVDGVEVADLQEWIDSGEAPSTLAATDSESLATILVGGLYAFSSNSEGAQ